MLQFFQNTLILLQNKNNRRTDVGELSHYFLGRCCVEIACCGGNSPTTCCGIYCTHTNLNTALFQSECIAIQSNKTFVNTLLSLSAKLFDCTGKQNNDTIMSIGRLVNQTNIVRGFAGLHITNTQAAAHKAINLIRISQQIHNFVCRFVQFIDSIAIPVFFFQQIQSIAIPEFRRVFCFCGHIPRSMVIFFYKMSPVNPDKQSCMESVNDLFTLVRCQFGSAIHHGIHVIVHVYQIGNHLFCNRNCAGAHVQQYGTNDIFLIIRHFHTPL